MMTECECIQIDEGDAEEIPQYYKYKGYGGFDGNFNHCDGRKNP